MNLTNQPVHQKRAKESDEIRKASQGQTCTLRIPGVCNNNPETTVGCHVRLSGFCGTALKPSNLFIIDGCSSCHSVLDSRYEWGKYGFTYQDVLRALMETQERRMKDGFISMR